LYRYLITNAEQIGKHPAPHFNACRNIANLVLLPWIACY
jgi:hypothetical protein